MNHFHRRTRRLAGFAMIEVLITVLILVFGLLGLVGLQSRAQTLETESYQRVQALVLLRDIADRLQANRINAAAYVAGTATPAGQGSVLNCAPPVAAGVAFDLCQWDAALKGAAETSAGGALIGAMIGARGCVTDITPVTVPPSPPQYLIQVAWQGLAMTAAAPASLVCGTGLYGDEALRRVVSTVVTIGTLDS
jgi:type IV pilus assembly protein PilV